ncbi:MAG TPA: HXXEE domain-containing protein [Spirochaetota bacterium]|nr:HXXEE domain-containing protein [Spirochaetota bacterium]HPI89082.1 HXXEE domain-containing protein [Spirochaetota bacterium]HPR48707.1 HXXEE domain-containing protein [Spirochaetota bacterium]
MKIETLLWLFPVIFMIHDFEEVIFLKPWLRRNKESLAEAFPFFARVMAHIDGLSTPAYTLVVAEEFLLLSAVTLVCAEFELFNVFAAVQLVFMVHLIVHAAQVILIKRYAPVIVSTLIAGVYSMYALQYLFLNGLLFYRHVLIFSLIAAVFFGLNFMVAHFLASYYDLKMKPGE